MRLYRLAFVPAVFAIIVAAFSLQGRERPIAGTPLAPDAFDGRRAISQLETLAAAFPDRRPGGRDDDRLADRVAAELRVGNVFAVTERRIDAQTADGERRLTTVVAVRQGLSQRRIVVVAHRDALEPRSAASLSGTAALLELSRVIRAGRSLRRTLVLVSTSGGTAGLAGAREFAEHPGGPVDAALVLGDMAGTDTRLPLVVPFSNGLGAAPPRLTDTVRAAVRSEVGLRPGGNRLPARFARLAFPLTLSEQGELLPRGTPSVLLSASGERGPGASSAVSRKRLQAFGRAALRAVTAVDGARSAGAAPDADLAVQTKVLPAVLAAVDGFARVRRRRQPVGMWLRWALTGALPFLLAALVAWLLRITGLIAAPGAPAPVGSVALNGSGVAALVAVALVFVLGWLALRPLVLRALGVQGKPESPGGAAALALVLVTVVALVWLGNPYAAALLLPALHVWLLALDPALPVRRAAWALLVLAALLPLALVALYYMRVFAMDPAELAWMGFLLVAGGGVGVAGVVLWSLLGGCLLGVLAILRRRPRPDAAEPALTRGPARYAGPGSLGGTKSALRR